MKIASGNIEILRPLFAVREDGRLAIEDLLIVPLKKDENSDPEFFEVKDDLLSKSPRYLSTILSTLGQSIVPIVAMIPGENTLRCLGTGFFVSVSGLLITAAHVLMDPVERNYGGVKEIDDRNWDIGSLNLGVLISTNPIFQRKGWIFRKIESAGLLAERTEHPLPFKTRELKLTSDTAICKVESPHADWLYQPLSVVQSGIQGLGLMEGKKATAIGYASMQDVPLNPLNSQIAEGELRFSLHVAQGEILERFPDNAVNRHVRTPGACFSARLKLPGGMSGSPIFDDENIYVHGVVSSGWEDETGPIKHGYGSMLAHSMRLPILPLNNSSLLDAIKSGEHGMPQISIPDA